MKNALWNRGRRFRGVPDASDNRIAHPILGHSYGDYKTWQVHTGPVYDVTTGDELTREELLAFSFFYPGTLHNVPVEIALWVFAEEADVSVTWDGLTAAQLLTAGYSYAENPIDGRVRTPEDDYDRAEVYLPEDEKGTPTESYPQPSIFSAAVRDAILFEGAFPGTATNGGVRIVSGTNDSRAALMILGREDSDPGDESEIMEEDTGIPLDEGTYKLKYSRITNARSKSVGFLASAIPVNGAALYLADYRVWAAPVQGSADTVTVPQQTIIHPDATYDVLYPEYGEILEEVAADLQADDSTETVEAVPFGRSRISLTPLTPTITYDGDITITRAEVTKQFQRFLPGQTGGTS